MEPLQTDEKLDQPIKVERDMDSQMLVGCTGFVVTSLATYFLAIWPFLVWLSIERLGVLALASTAAFFPVFVTGAIACRKAGLAGAAGFVGGMLAVAIFLYLRMEQLFVEVLARRIPEPEYPKALQYLIPLAAVFGALLIALLFLDRETIGAETDGTR